jgi:hypothetical protein
MPTIKGFHSSGEWDQPAALLEADVRRTRAGGRSFGTRTEVTTAAHHDALWQTDGWRVYHPKASEVAPELATYVDCSLEWDGAVWKRVEKRLMVLNESRLHTAKGFLLPPSSMPLVVLEHRETGRHMVLGAFHLQLANTAARRAAWRVEAATIRRASADLRVTHPGWEQVFQGDGNRNQRITALRDAVEARMLRGTRLRNCWEGHIPARGGTHGPRSLLDLTVSTMPGGSRLLGDDASSDHRPYETDLTL